MIIRDNMCCCVWACLTAPWQLAAGQPQVTSWVNITVHISQKRENKIKEKARLSRQVCIPVFFIHGVTFATMTVTLTPLIRVKFCCSCSLCLGPDTVSSGSGMLDGRWCSSGNIGSSEYWSKSTFPIKISLIMSNFVGPCISFLTVCNLWGRCMDSAKLSHFRIHTPLSRITHGGDQRAVLKK